MHSISKIVSLALATLFTIGAGFSAISNNSEILIPKGSDLIFANGFETGQSLSLSSETPFSGSLPVLESGHDSVGFTQGSFNVDQTGQASYSLPIFAGAGTAGVAPKVSLQYSSAGGNGHVGVGWAISGVTIMSRCRETEESRDGSSEIIPSPITFGVEDKFCLNGERLFVSNGGVYGSNATEYRTEKDQFARVISYDTTDGDNNPDYFTVERKDGSISHYGNTTDSDITVTSSITVVNNKTYAWAINRYQDSLGNYVDYAYDKFANSEFVLRDIFFTGNDTVSPVLNTYNSLHFIYDGDGGIGYRNDTFTSYLGSVAFATTRRLAQIQSNIDGTTVREYTLLYDDSITTSRSILKSIEECADTDCLPLTSFDWSQPDKKFNTTANTSAITFPSDITSSKLGDINADGRSDLVFIDDNSSTFKVALANGDTGFGIGTTTSIPKPTGIEVDNKWQLIDFNADGRQDLLKQVGSSWFIYLANSGSIGFSSSATTTGISEDAGSDFQIVDVNGDGLADLLYEKGEILYVRYLEVSGSSYGFSSTAIEIDLPNFASMVTGITPPSGIGFMQYQFHRSGQINIVANDVNGDGVADLLLKSDVYTLQTITTASAEEESYKFMSADKEQIVTLGEPLPVLDSSHWVAFIANGIDTNGKLDFYSENYYIREYSANKHIKFTDINADGLTDVLARDTANNWQYILSNGKGFNTFANVGSISNEDHMQLFDYNLDGYVDVVYPLSVSGQPYYAKRWTGNGFSSQSYIGANAEDYNQNLNLFMDLNGDGATDHIRVTSGSIQKIYPRADIYNAPDQITTFTNGLGASTEVLYRPLTFSSTYTQGNHQTTVLNYGLGSPVLDIMGAIYVVRQVETTSPIEGDEDFQNTIRYRYENAKIQTGGRGFLGFEKVITATPVQASDDSVAKILQTTTTYRQDFPYNGIPINTEIRQLTDDFYSVNNTPPICSGNDDCFPPPCEVGTTCTIVPKALAGVETLLSNVDNIPNKNDTAITNSKSTFAIVETSTMATYSPETQSLLKTETQTTTHDDFGNPLTHSITTKDGSGTTIQTVVTTNIYSSFTSANIWLTGLLEKSTTVKTRIGKPSITTVTEFDYNQTTGLLIEERKEPLGGDELFLRTIYKYDKYGNNEKTILCSGNDLTSFQCENNTPTSSNAANPYLIHRYNRTVFDSKGRYVDESYNTLEQKLSDVTSRDAYGNPKNSVDVLGQTTTNAYDSFGRLTSTRNTMGVWSQTSRQWCAGLTGDLACPSGMDAQIRVRKQDAGGNESYIYMDSLAREVATITRSFNAINDGNTSGDDKYIVNKIWHDQFGRKIKSLGNHFLGASTTNIPTTNTEYDRYNRSTKIILPDNSQETMAYSGFQTDYTNDLGQRRQETHNALGQLTQVQDFDITGLTPNYKNSMSYQYDSQGSLLNVTRNANGTIERLIENEYDDRNRKINTDDVDTGYSEIFYNALGEAVITTDSENNSIKSYFDVLGRAYLTESWQNTTKLTTNTNSYNSSNGLLESESKTTIAGSIVYTKNHSYDAFKRPTTTDISFTDVDDICTGSLCQYQANLYYDTFSRLKYQQDVSGKAIENHYNIRGFLSHVTDAEDVNKEYYRINKTDKWGNILSDTKAGNASLYATYTYDIDRGWLNSITTPFLQQYVYEYDDIGNLIKRADISNDQSECFKYDRLNRLRDTYRYNNFGQNCSSTTGNVEHKATSYDAKGNLSTKDGSSYVYLTGSNNAIGVSPHQVQSKGSQVFSYDSRGNVTQSTNFRNSQDQLVNRNITYTGFNKISKVYTGSVLTPIAQSQYRYDNAENRYSRTDINDQNQTTVTHFLGSVEIQYDQSGQIKFKRHLGNFAVVTEINTTTQESYLFHDHLGSIDVITDSNATILQQMSFSAWGERRAPTNWDTIPIPTTRLYISNYTTKGFTGHEMLDEFGLINMGGRIYDPALGKMLQADPVVQDPNTSQSYNRYSYVHNNPLSFTDPSGYFSLRQLIAAVVGIVLVFVLPGLGFHIFWTGFTSAFAGTIILTGNLKSALKAGLIAGAIAFAGSQFANTGAADAANAGTPSTAGGVGDISTGTALSEVAPTVSTASKIAAAFKGINAFDLAIQVTASLNPKAGAVLSFLHGGIVANGKLLNIGGTVHNLVSIYGKFKAQEELQRFARKNGLTLAELNLALVAMSFAGNKLVGTRFNPDEQIKGESSQVMHGMFDRQGKNNPLISPDTSRTLNRIIGSSFDVIDVVLGYTGLLAASDYDFLKSGNIKQKLYGHSLGTLGVSNLVARGYLDSGLAEIYSLPFGNITPNGVKLFIGTMDGVNGFVFGLLLNPRANLINGCFHPFQCYLDKTKSN